MSNSNNKYKKQLQPVKILKVIVIGDSGVGKTNILNTFSQGKFRQNYVATIGVDFKIKTININGKIIKLQIWDTAGQERFRTIAQTYYKGAAGIILTYAINDSASFKNISSWLKQIQSHASQNVCKLLVGSKSDLQQQRLISFDQGKHLAIKYGLHFQQASAKSGHNIQEIFIQIAKMIVNKKTNNNNTGDDDFTMVRSVCLEDSRNKSDDKGCQC